MLLTKCSTGINENKSMYIRQKLINKNNKRRRKKTSSKRYNNPELLIIPRVKLTLDQDIPSTLVISLPG